MDASAIYIFVKYLFCLLLYLLYFILDHHHNHNDHAPPRPPPWPQIRPPATKKAITTATNISTTTNFEITPGYHILYSVYSYIRVDAKESRLRGITRHYHHRRNISKNKKCISKNISARGVYVSRKIYANHLLTLFICNNLKTGIKGEK